MERRWEAILGPGTWPEVLRRYALVRAGAHVFSPSPQPCDVTAPLKVVCGRSNRKGQLPIA